MIVTVIGKQIKNGISHRTGRLVNGCVLHVKYVNDDVDGEAVGTYWLDVRCCKQQTIKIGQSYILEERNDYVIKIECTKKLDCQKD